MFRSLLFASAGIACFSVTAHAQDATILHGDGFRMIGGIGYTFLSSDEIVYDSGNRISHLFWQSRAPTVTASLEVELGDRWTVAVNGALAALGNSHMEDYDWLTPYRVGYNFDDWTHRSVHPDTLLHHYFSGDVALSRTMPIPGAALSVEGGFSYTDVAWTARGGSFIYSASGFRDSVGNFAAGVPGISFQQRYPGAFLGAGIAASRGRLSFKGKVRGGLSLGATDTDHHWARDLRFEESYGAIPFASVAARIDYAFNDRSSVFVGGSFKRFFHALGSSTVYDIPTGAQLGPPNQNASGMTLQAVTVSAGLKIRF